MTRVLVADSDPYRRQALVAALQRRGARVIAAPDGLYALTLLERNRPEIVLVVGAFLTDMDAVELSRIVRSDGALGDVLVALMAPAGFRPEPATLFDLILDCAADAEDAAEKVLQLAKASVRATTHTRIEAHSASKALEEATHLHGTLEILDLPELTQAICNARKTGKLELSLEEGAAAEIYFLDGQVIHTAYQSVAGMDAFRKILAVTLEHPEFGFVFSPLGKAEIFRCPRTINMTPQRLLLTMAVQIDESRLDGRGDGGTILRKPQ